MRVPLLLETGGMMPGVSEGLLVRTDPGADDVLVVRDLGSSMRPLEEGAEWAHLEIPAEHPLPPALVDELDQVP